MNIVDLIPLEQKLEREIKATKDRHERLAQELTATEILIKKLRDEEAEMSHYD